MVRPSIARFLITLITSCSSSGSSAEVGSSNSKALGSIARPRAIAARCCWPPESWAGQTSHLSPIPTFSRYSRATCSACSLSCPRTVTGASITFCKIVICDHRLNCWNTIDKLVRMRMTCSLSDGRRPNPSPFHLTSSPLKKICPC